MSAKEITELKQRIIVLEAQSIRAAKKLEQVQAGAMKCKQRSDSGSSQANASTAKNKAQDKTIEELKARVDLTVEPIHLGAVTTFPSVTDYRQVYFIPHCRDYYWDTIRNKWLSVSELIIAAGRNGNTTDYLRWFNGSTIDTNSGLGIHRSIVVTSVSATWDEGQNRSGTIRIIEDQNSGDNTAWSYDFPSTNHFSVEDLDVPILSGDLSGGNKRFYFRLVDVSASIPNPRLRMLFRFWGDPA